jgi:membrane-anchored protein YejM (alkaline phosphatase superfamily)
MPGKPHRDIQRITSHMDIAVTLLQMLGASNDVSDYALGRNLFDESPRDFVVISDWHSIAVVSDDFKYRIPYISRSIENYKPTHRNDRVVC